MGQVKSEGLKVWYDQFELTVGDRLLDSIETGLKGAQFGIVVLSPYFFGKHWPKLELDALATREVGGTKVILPIWLDIDFEDVSQFSPILAGRLAGKASQGMDRVVADLLAAILR